MKSLKLYFLFFLVALAGCKDDSFTDKSYPRVETLPVTQTGNGHLVFSGRVTLPADHEILERGFVWSIEQGPALERSFSVIVEEPEGETFSYELSSGFVENTIHYVRAFLKTTDYTVYGPVVTITPSETGNMLQGISPTEANIGESIIITGINFDQLPDQFGVFFGDVQGNITEVTDSEIHVTVPEGLVTDRNVEFTTDVDVSILAANATFNLESDFTLNYPGKWVQLDDFPGAARISAVSFQVGSTGYFGLGSSRCPVSTFYNDLWKYTPETDTWIEIVTPLTPRSSPTTFVYGSKIYIMGGQTASGLISEVWEFDTATGDWTQKNDYPGLPRKFGFGFVIGNYGYYGAAASDFACGNSYDNQFWRYDLINDSWLRLDDIFEGESIGQVSVSTTNRFFVLKAVNKLYEFNGTTYQWTLVSQIPFSTYNPLSGFAVNDDILSFGSTFISEGNEIVYQFNLTTLKWENRTYITDKYSEAIGGFSFNNAGIVIINKEPFEKIEIWRLDP